MPTVERPAFSRVTPHEQLVDLRGQRDPRAPPSSSHWAQQLVTAYVLLLAMIGPLVAR